MQEQALKVQLKEATEHRTDPGLALVQQRKKKIPIFSRDICFSFTVLSQFLFKEESYALRTRLRGFVVCR